MKFSKCSYFPFWKMSSNSWNQLTFFLKHKNPEKLIIANEMGFSKNENSIVLFSLITSVCFILFNQSITFCHETPCRKKRVVESFNLALWTNEISCVFERVHRVFNPGQRKKCVDIWRIGHPSKVRYRRSLKGSRIPIALNRKIDRSMCPIH